MPPLPTPRPASSHKDPHARLPSTRAGSQLGVPSWEEKNGRDPLGQKVSQNPRQSDRCEQPPHFTIGEMVPLRGSPKRPLQEPSPTSSSKSEVMTPVGPKPQTPAGSSALGGLLNPILEGTVGGMGKPEKSPSKTHRGLPEVPPLSPPPPPSRCRLELTRSLTPPSPKIPLLLQDERCPRSWQPMGPASTRIHSSYPPMT